MASDSYAQKLLVKRYAKALFLSAKQQSVIPDIERDLRSFHAAFKESALLRDMIVSPIVSPASQGNALKKIAAHLKFSPLVERFLVLLAKKRRLPLVHDIIHAFEDLASEARGEVKVQVFVAKPLTPEQATQIEKELHAVLKRPVVLKVGVKPSLLGGIVIQVGSIMVDGSIRYALARLRRITTQAIAESF